MFGRLIPTLLDVVFALVESHLSLRVFLKFLGASTQAPFVRWIYDTTNPLLAPFENMFPTSNLGQGLVLEASALFALVVYAFIGFLLESLFVSLSNSHKK